MKIDHNDLIIHNQLAQFLVAHSQEAIILLDHESRIVIYNPIAEKLFNCPAAEALGKSFNEFCLQSTKNCFSKQDWQRFLGANLIHSIPANAGEELSLTWLIERIKINDTNFLILQTTNYEIKKQHNEIFRLETLIENMPCNVYWMDKDCLMLGCNQNVLSMLNMTREQFKGKSYEELAVLCNWPNGLAEKLKNDDLHVMTTGQPIFGIEDPPIPHINNTVLNLLTSRVPLRDNTGKVVGVAGISVDITALKEARLLAETANQAKTEFIANMSHDIRTPLSGIIGMSKFLEEGAGNPQEKQYARWVNESGEQLLKLLNGVLDVVSAEQVSEEDIHQETFDLRQSIEGIVRLEQPMIYQKNLNLEVKIDQQIPQFLVSDRFKLHRILLNLVGNAIKFTENGRVLIGISQRSKTNERIELDFRITDTGTGIPKELQSKVFERFYRISPSYKGEYHGHGVGLHIVEKYVSLLGGKIQLESEEGKGTTFYFTLSMAIGKKEDAVISEPIQPANTSSSKEPINIQPSNSSLELPADSDSPYLLLVEDNLIALKIVETITQQTGCRFVSATDGEKAFKLATSQHFDLILTDIGLPGMSGNELARAIRKWETDNSLPSIPIVGLTAHGLIAAKPESLQAGMNMVISKPIQLATLQTVINQFIKSCNIQKTKTLGVDLPETEDELFLLDHYPLFDLETGITNLGNEDVLRELLSLMLNQELPGDSLKIQSAYNEQNWDKIEDLAHKLKSGAVYCGTIRLKYACQYLERYHKAGHTHKLEQLYHQLIQVINDSQREIKEWLAQENHVSL
ncbi:sensory box histidine kinase/response regulator [Legionella donaldsonii]|uniref:histidine kinase n=1 Tax=Legionella donaldsonii TaxID=45060 RepID=A0A378J8G4_9GAMM|nr:ATP-binding protein [Legionella donaldsonii]STX40830.1 sensory box histidine kinase/response regulator [Legionella donaldsonii]